VILPVSVAQGRHYEPSMMSLSLYVFPRSDRLSDRLLDDIRELLRRNRGIAATERDDFIMASSLAARDAVTATADTVRIIIVLLACWGVVVSLVGVLNSIFMSVVERAHEIGVSRAVGARKRDIARVFFVESTLVAFAGAVAGAAAGALAAAGLAGVLGTPATVDMPATVATIVGCTASGALCGVWPARAAARLEPVDALRREGLQ
jgi:putative ABC transport system permease protein